jgi:AraC-like DNA-binding protein
MIIFADMKHEFHQQIVYSTVFNQINSPAYYGCVVHLICLQGSGSFVYNDKTFTLNCNDIAVISRPDLVTNLLADDIDVAYIVAPDNLLHSLLPQNNYSIVGCISLFSNPIISVNENDATRFVDDIRRIRERIPDTENPFYRETIGSMLLTMMYDLFAFHAHATESNATTNRAGYIVQRFMMLIGSNHIRNHREVGYYADLLHITSKYLSDTVRRATGQSALSHINQSLVIVIKDYLDNSDLSIVQIADELHFESLSYFSRFCTKHLGMPPSEYRKSKR